MCVLCTLVTWLDVHLRCCHTSLFVTYALRGVTSQQKNCLRKIAYHDTGSDTVTVQMPSAKTNTQLMDP